MKIIEKSRRNDKKERDVYAVYWAEHLGINERYYLFIPYDGCEGVGAIKNSECEVVDVSVDDFVLISNDNGSDMLVHKEAYRDSLLDRLIEHEPDAMKEFILRLASLKEKNDG